MADLSQTAASVKLKSSTFPPIVGTAGESLTQGQPVYPKSTDSNKYWRADADTLAESLATHIVLTPAAANGPVLLARPGSVVDLGATMTVGIPLCVSTNVGAICPYSDLASGDFPTIIGLPRAATEVELIMYALGVAKP